jgi:RHS repeat-associated protein
MLTAAKEGTFSASSDPCVFFPLAASEGVPKNSRLGFARKNPAPHQGSAWSNSGKALGIEEVVWENYGRSDDSARYYDPFSGRFVSEDPARFPGGINFYTFVENSPVNLIDPFGFCPWQVHSRPLKGAAGGAAHSIGIDHYYFYNVQTGQSIGLGPAGGMSGGTTKGSPVPGTWERNEKPGHNVDPVPDWACSCVDKKAKNPGNPPNYCTYQGSKNTNPHPPCTNCAGWVLSVLQDCYNQAYAGQQ